MVEDSERSRRVTYPEQSRRTCHSEVLTKDENFLGSKSIYLKISAPRA